MTRRARLFVALALGLTLATAGRAAAQAPRPIELLVTPDTGDDRAWGARLATALGRGGHAVRDVRTEEDADEVFLVESAQLGSLDASRVDALARVADLLTAARTDAAALHEGRALSALAQAAQITEAHADVAGSAAWNAEVQTAIGVVAAQAGLANVSADALARAATLDASRGVRAAEATPAVVAQAAEIARRIATGPTGAFEVSTDALGARIFVDDADVGFAPRTVRAPVGRHVLRIEAPGRRPYGTMLDVFEGAAPTLHVTLAADPLLSLGRALVAASRAGDTAAVAAAIRALAAEGMTLAAVWIVRSSPDGDRALVTFVGAATRTWGVVRTVLPERIVGPRDLDDADAVADAREAFLHPAPIVVPPPPDPFWSGPLPWIIGGVLVAAGVSVGIGTAVYDPGRPDHHVIVD